jgi:tetratricopeptide (TPR) repeat protein
MFFNGDGRAVDWIFGYAPPADKYKDLLDKARQGIDTFESLRRGYAEEPNSIETVFKLGQKYKDISNQEKAAEFFQKVIALDPKGTQGQVEFGPDKVSFAEYAEFNLGTTAIYFKQPPDPGPLRALIEKNPGAKIARPAYLFLGLAYYQRTAPKAEAANFFAEFAGRFPEEIRAKSIWIQRILQDKEPVDQGIELALRGLEQANAAAPTEFSAADKSVLALNLARLYNLRGNRAKAVETVDAAFHETGENAQTLSSIAQAYLDLGREAKALAVYGPAFSQKNNGSAATLRGYATFWASLDKNLDSALEAARKGAELAPGDYRSWTTLGNVYLKLKNAAEAVKAAEKALQVAPAGFQSVARRLADQIKTQAAAIK